MLMQEHREIERVLGALEGCARRLDAGEPVAREAIRDFGDFFANFADKCHHAKEEDGLFVSMEEHGFPREAGPVGVMLMEHTEGRRHVSALRRIGEGTGELTPEERRELAAHARDYAVLLQDHIQKEDEILYPMAERTIPTQAFHQLLQEFEQLEADRTGPDEHRRLLALASRLVQTFSD
jgi:hemerythrin-like domain-containing protein